MLLEINYQATTVLEDVEDFTREISVDVVDMGLDGEYLVGRMQITKVLWGEAQYAEVPIDVVCDEDSQGLLDVYSILRDRRNPQKFRDDLELELSDEVLFLWRYVLHPDILDHRAVIDAVLREVGTTDSLVVAWHKSDSCTPVSDADLSDLGFKLIAGSSLIYRDQHLRNRFGDDFPGGRELFIDATPDYEAWVLDRWEGGSVARDQAT